MHHLASKLSYTNQTHPQYCVTNMCMLGLANMLNTKMLLVDPAAVNFY